MIKAPHPVTGGSTDRSTMPGQVRPDSLLQEDEVGGNAGPDCFWQSDSATLPTPRIAEVHSLDQQPKPTGAR